MPADRPEEAKKTKELADELRALILTDDWPPGYVLPSQSELERQHGVSTVTVRNAVSTLAEEGLIEKSQGRRSRVANREPAHRLVIRRPVHATGQPADGAAGGAGGSGGAGGGSATGGGSGAAESSGAGGVADRVAEPPISFAGGPDAGTPQRQHEQRTVAMPRLFASLLGLEPGEVLVERRLTLIVGKEPILTSTSYLPVDLAAGDQSWHDVEVGQLAVVGHTVHAEFVEERARMPIPAESEALRIGRGVPVRVLSQPCRVVAAGQPAGRSLPAGVIVLARCDRVFLRWD